MLPLALALAAQVAGPAGLDFDVRLRSCAGLAGVTGLANAGDGPLRVDAARVEGVPGLVIASAPTFPRVLDPGERLTVGLGFEGADLGAFGGAIAFDTAAGPFRTTLTGEIAAVVEDRHRAPSVEQVDVLFVLDDAPSMADERRALEANMQAFAQYVRAQGLDAHLALTTPGLGGRFRRLRDGRAYITSADDDLELAFAELAQAELRDRADRRGIQAALDGLQTAGDHAPGFLRPEAVLSVIFVSDADDRSARSVSIALAEIADFKGFWRPFRVSVSAIVPDVPGGCTGVGGTGTAAPRYRALAEETGGVFHSICTADWSRSLEDLSTAAFGFKSRYRLSRQPSSHDIEVFVNQAMIPDRSASGTIYWSYDSASNSVNFSQFAAPEPAAEVLLRYRPGCPFARPQAGTPR